MSSPAGRGLRRDRVVPECTRVSLCAKKAPCGDEASDMAPQVAPGDGGKHSLDRLDACAFRLGGNRVEQLA